MINDDILGIPQIQVWAASGGFLLVERLALGDGEWVLSRKIAITPEEAGAMVAHILTTQGQCDVVEFENDYSGDEVPTE